MPMRNTCVVLGFQHNGLGVARALGREGIEVIGIDAIGDTADARTRYARLVACPRFRDSGLIDTLRAIGRDLSQPGVLIPTTDRSVELVSENRNLLEPHFVHSLPSRELVQRLLDKAEIATFAEREGFSVPLTVKVSSEDELNAAASEIGFPCILKPQVKSEAFVSSRAPKAFRVRTLGELRQAYASVAPFESRFVIQEWIPNPDTALIFCLYYFNSNGEPLASFTGRKLRQFIPYCGTACSAEPWEDEHVRQAGIRFFQRSGYRGFGAIEFKKAASGRYFLMEPTIGRTEHLFAMAAANGVNLPYVGYCDMIGQPPPMMARARRPIKYLHWKRDVKAAITYLRAGDLTFKEWMSSLRGPKQYPLFAWDDLAPIRFQLRRSLTAKPKRVFRRVNQNRGLQAAFGFLHEVRSNMERRAASPQGAAARLAAAISWLVAAQDACGGEGVSRAYTVRADNLLPVGWQPAYPETTGYIIGTFFDYAVAAQQPHLHDRALRLADWLLTLQCENGGIPGGTHLTNPAVIFNTGMVISGWCRAFHETGNPAYLAALHHASRFLVGAQDADGAWRRFSNWQTHSQVHAYDVLVCWPLLMAYELTGDTELRAASIRNLDFTLSLQKENGWFPSNGFSPKRNRHPLTHAMGYVAAGFLQCGLLLHRDQYVEAAIDLAHPLREQVHANGFLSGEFDADWKPAVSWSCLTGSAQMAVVWFTLWRSTGDREYLKAALSVMRFLSDRQNLTSTNIGVRGGISGSYPIHGRYGRFQYLNWAAKFYADALLEESRVHASEPDPLVQPHVSVLSEVGQS